MLLNEYTPLKYSVYINKKSPIIIKTILDLYSLSFSTLCIVANKIIITATKESRSTVELLFPKLKSKKASLNTKNNCKAIKDARLTIIVLWDSFFLRSINSEIKKHRENTPKILI